MAVVLIAIFPIVLLINSQMAWLSVSLGIVLLYLDSRRGSSLQTVRSRASAPVRSGSAPAKRSRPSRRAGQSAPVQSRAIGAMTRA